MPRRAYEVVFEVMALVAEDFSYAQAILVGAFHDVVEHRIVAGQFFDDGPDGGDFVCIKDGPEIVMVQLGGESGGHSHELVRDDNGIAFRVCRADRL